MIDEVEGARERQRVRRQVLNCRRCKLILECRRPVPFRGPTPARVAIVGEAPGREEDKTGRPFVGRSGKVVERLFPYPLAQTFICNSVSCYPHRTPSTDEVVACRPNMWEQLALARPQWIVVFGKVAYKSLLEPVIGFWVRGRPMALGDLWGTGEVYGYATFHPAAGLRDKDYMRTIEGDLRRLPDAMAMVSWEDCVACGGEMEHFDAHMLGWCDVCWKGRSAL